MTHFREHVGIVRIELARPLVGGEGFVMLALVQKGGTPGGMAARVRGIEPDGLFRLPAKVETRAVPWVTYTDPELAQVGLTEAAARREHGAIRVLRWPFAENDRARAERSTVGLVKAIASPRGRVLGASILGAQAGELIQPWTLAIAQGIKLSAMAGTIAPYPTRGEASKRAAGGFYAEKISSRWTQGLVRLLLRLG